MVMVMARPNADNFGNLLQAGFYGVGIRAYVIWARRVWSADHLQPGPEVPALPQFTQSIKIKGRWYHSLSAQVMSRSRLF